VEYQRLGRTDIKIPPILFGGNVFGWTANETTSCQLLDELMAAGFNAIDTADMYATWVPGNSGGESETIIGNWLRRRGRRADVVVATKVGGEMGSEGGSLSPGWIRKAADNSLRRLQTDYIDLYQAHEDDVTTPLDETLEAFASLIRQGKVRAIGASNYTAPRLMEALATSDRLGLPRYMTLQPHYNLVERTNYESELEPVCLREGLGVISYFALAGGYLTGKYRHEGDLAQSERGEGARQYINCRGRRILQAMDAVAAARGATPAQVAIAWLIARPSISAPIVSARNVLQLRDLIAAASLRLDDEAIEILNEASF
jgi:aryl-alcohol dehydrogenase-like predicted oxidoreductase